MTRGRTLTRTLLGVGLLAALALALGACGKKGEPHPPEGQEDAYTFPRFFPPPGKSPPIFGGTPAAAAPESEPETDRRKKRRTKALGKAEEDQRRPFRRRPDFDPYSDGIDTFGTYETSPK